MRFSDDLIDEVRRKNDITEIIGQYVRLKRSGSRYTGLCPFHNEKTPSFSVNPSKQLYYCFGCHAGGNVITFLMEYQNLTFVEAVRYLAERAGVEVPEDSFSEEQREAARKKNFSFEVMKTAASFYYYRLNSEAGENGMRYLKDRGLSEETIRRFGLGYADRFGRSLYRYLKQKEIPDEELLRLGLVRFDEQKGARDTFFNRVMFPIMDVRGRVIGFGGRVLGEGVPKYLNSPETALFNKRKNLYGLHIARSSRSPYIILCEGYMDVISMHQAGFSNACASLGTALTEEQAMLLRRYTGEIKLLYDSDGAGVQAALRAIPILEEAGITPSVVNLAPYKDPDELLLSIGAEGLKERLEQSENAFMFEVRQMEGRFRRSDPAEWTSFQREVVRLLFERFPDELERNNYIDAVCAHYNFPREAMVRGISREAASGIRSGSVRRGTAAGSEGRTEPSRRQNKEDPHVTEERMMLSYLAAFPEAYTLTKDLIGPDDYKDPISRKVAEALYGELAEGSVSESRLIQLFAEAEEQRAAAGIFHAMIPVRSEADQNRAFTDTVIRMLRHIIDRRLLSEDITDPSVYRAYLDGRKKLEELEKGKVLRLPWKG